MQTKIVIRTVFFSLVLVALAWAGVYAFLQLRTGEQVYHAELFDLVSDENELLFHFTRPEELPGLFPKALLPDTACLSVAAGLCRDQGKKWPGAQRLILAYRKKKGLILYRATPEQIGRWEKNQQASGFFVYPPVEKRYQDIDYKVSLTAGDRFFCYAYRQGAFLGSYSPSLLENALDMFTADEKAIRNPSFVQARQSVSNTSFAECYFKEKTQWYGLDLTENKGNLWMSGRLRSGQTPDSGTRTVPAHTAQTELLTRFIPATTTALAFFRADTSLFDSGSVADPLLKKYATGNAAICYYASVDTSETYFRTCCFELRQPREFFLAEMSALLPDSSLTRTRHVWYQKDDYILYSIYRTDESAGISAALGRFSRKEDVYFTFYTNHLLVSDSQEALLQYWKQVHTRRNLPPDAPLLETYQNHRSEEASLFLIVSQEALTNHPLASKDLRLKAFSNAAACPVFLQFIPGEEMTLYNGRVLAKTEDL